MILLTAVTNNRMIILIDTIAAPLGILKEYASHNPKNTDSSEKIIDTIRVDLYDQPSFIPAATGITIIDEIKRTPADSNSTDTTIDSMTINTIWNILTLIPRNLALDSSKLTASICLAKKINNIATITAVIKIRII
jgi:hypothetical protein